MIPKVAGSETELITAYQEEAELYRRAIALAEPLVATLRQGEDVAVPLSRVLALIDEVAAVESKISAAREQWTRTQVQPGPELRGLLGTLGALVEHLAQILSEAEQEARRRYQQMIPQIDTLIRAQDMRRAYQNVSRLSRFSR